MVFNTCHDSVLENMKKEAVKFVSELTSNNIANPRWLTMLGGSGTGKSYLSQQIFNYFSANHKIYRAPINKDYPEMITTHRHDIGFYCASELASEIRSGNQYILKQIKKDYLVVIDDMGGEYETEFMSAVWFQLLNSRIGKWTVINSNKSISEISEHMDNRIASRINRGANRFINCLTSDYGFRKDVG